MSRNKSQQLTSVSNNGSGRSGYQMVETDLERDEQSSLTSLLDQPQGMKNGIIRVEGTCNLNELRVPNFQLLQLS